LRSGKVVDTLRAKIQRTEEKRVKPVGFEAAGSLTAFPVAALQARSTIAAPQTIRGHS
jgi:hypothetical protein